jgi:hypothetical protein
MSLKQGARHRAAAKDQAIKSNHGTQTIKQEAKRLHKK